MIFAKLTQTHMESKEHFFLFYLKTGEIAAFLPLKTNLEPLKCGKQFFKSVTILI